MKQGSEYPSAYAMQDFISSWSNRLVKNFYAIFRDFGCIYRDIDQQVFLKEVTLKILGNSQKNIFDGIQF